MDPFDDPRYVPGPEHLDGGGATAGPSTTSGGRSARSEREEGSAGAHGAEQNRLLAALPLAEYAGVLPSLTPVRLHVRDVLVEADEPMRDVWFVREGVCAVLTGGHGRGELEIGAIGCEGFVGLPVLNGVDRMSHRVMVHIAGDAWRLPAEAFARLVDERPMVQRLLLRYSQYFTEQVSQTAACSRLHTLEERCARWLLMTHDRVRGDAFEITHDLLSQTLGVQRTSVTAAMGAMQAEGMVHYLRGRVRVVDRPRLEEASCACYHVTRGAFARLLE